MIWPDGTEFIEDGRIDIEMVGALNIGDRVEGGGGYYEVEDVSGESLRRTLESCAADGLFARIRF